MISLGKIQCHLNNKNSLKGLIDIKFANNAFKHFPIDPNPDNLPRQVFYTYSFH